MYTMGIDIGSASSKAVILKDGEEVVAKLVVSLGTGTTGSEQVYNAVLEEAGISQKDLAYTVVTGYGRMKFPYADTQVSELSCHAVGIHYLLPAARTVIDIGGQDAKALQVSSSGRLMNFVMNDKCAAGTGRFLEVMSRVLDIPITEMGAISARSTQEVSISSTCTVFAESEVISQLSNNEKIEDIVAGIHRSVAKRVAGMALRIGCEPEVAMSGGVALNSGIVSAMEKELGTSIMVHPDCQLAGAFGAALLAWEKISEKERKVHE